MLTIRTAAHVRSPLSVKGFRSCPASTGKHVPEVDATRSAGAEARCFLNESRRHWLAGCWTKHQARVRAQRGE